MQLRNTKTSHLGSRLLYRLAAGAFNHECQCAVTAAETELAQVRDDLRAAHSQTHYLSQQWANMHADLLAERDLHEASTPVTTLLLRWSARIKQSMSYCCL